jgi:oligopeptide transport system permease protein
LEPIYETRFIYFGVTMTNVLGSQNLDVSSEFETAMPYSFTYGLITITISYLLGVPLGILAAIKNKKISGKLMNSVSLFIYSLPSVIIIMFFFLLPVGFFSQSSLFFSESF